MHTLDFKIITERIEWKRAKNFQYDMSFFNCFVFQYWWENNIRISIHVHLFEIYPLLNNVFIISYSFKHFFLSLGLLSESEDNLNVTSPWYALFPRNFLAPATIKKHSIYFQTAMKKMKFQKWIGFVIAIFGWSSKDRQNS